MVKTRSKWDEFYRNHYSELKRKKDQESGGNSGGDKRVRNGVDSEYIVVDRNGGKIGEKHCAKTIEHVESTVSRRLRNVAGKRVEEEGKDNNLASEKTRKLDGDSVLMSEDVVRFLSEQVVSNGSSLKTGPESRSGSGSKVGGLDEVVSSITKKVDSGGNNGRRGRGRPRIEPLNEKQIHRDVSVDLENSIDTGNLTESSNGSDNSVDSNVSESESTSEEDDELSDQDYKAGESPTCESSDDSSHGSDAEVEEDDEYDGENENVKIGEESYNVDDHGGSHCNRSSIQQKTEDVVIIINEKEKFSSVRRSRRISKKNETEVELESDDDEEGYNETNDGSGNNKTSTNWTNDGDVVNIIDDEEKFPSVRKSAKKNQNGSGELDGNLKKRNVFGDEDKFPSFRKSAKTNHKGDGELDGKLKKRNVFGLEVLVDSDKSKDKEEINLAKCGRYNSPVPVKSASSTDDDYSFHIDRVVRKGQQCMEKKLKLDRKKPRAETKLDLIKILVEYMNSPKEQQFTVEKNALTQNALPCKFCFEDEVLPPNEKSEWEKHIDSLFCNLELGLRESEIDCTSSSTMGNDEPNTIEIDESPAARCDRGEHEPILDEQMGIVCKYCFAVILEIKHVLPPFYTPPSVRRERKDSDELPSSFTDQIQFPGSAGETYDSTNCVRGTVWDLIPGVKMFPHQREGFEFIWKNIAGDIFIEKLKEPLPDGRGCIISHAPGTGKTRLAIVFLQTFLELYPSCCPVIIAPRGMLLTWEQECIKWKFNVPFLNLNKKELSGNENALGSQIFGQVGAGILSKEVIRLLKLYSWTRGGGILGVSYTLFEKLAGEYGKEGLHEKIRQVLLERPGLLVLDEGHTPRNDRSRIFEALTNVATQRRIILSGTPFQNNVTELYNTLCLVNPKFVNQIGLENNTSGKTRRQKDSLARKRWTTFIDSIGKNKNGLKKLRAMLDPFVHVYKGTILQDELPGLRHSLVFLHPAEYQKTLLEVSSKERRIFRRIRMVSLVSIHPSLEAVMDRYSSHKSKLEEIESDIDAGVKANFVMKLIWLADALGERVLVFSQFIDPLVFLKKQIESHLSWNEGRELLYMDGQLDEKQRQDSITSFNDDTSEAKVLLASERACSEGINLVGASRVVLLDTVWNPFVEQQAISRAYRFGQKKVVYVYRLFTSGIEVKQYAQQIKKVRLSELIFSPGDGQAIQSENSHVVSEDKVLEAMINLDRFNQIFEKIIHQPKASDLIEIFGLEEVN